MRNMALGRHIGQGVKACNGASAFVQILQCDQAAVEFQIQVQALLRRMIAKVREGIVVACIMSVLPARACLASLLCVLVLNLAILNQAPASEYFAQTLQTWEQGRFIRFHGVAQWLGWLWPYGVLGLALARAGRSDEGRA